ELIWDILLETHYREYVYAMPGGEQRRANVDMLLEKATTFEGTSYKGVFHFIRYIEQLQKYQVEYGEANMVDELDDAVRIMSIHKSKGLEFPIVFVIGMGKEFNKQDVRGTVAVHPDEGIGMDAIFPELRTKTTVLMKQVIRRKLEIDSLGEELRVLYVAMTRAKEKLILTGKLRDLRKKLDGLRAEIEATDIRKSEFGFLELASARTYLDWVLPSVYLKPQSTIRVREINLEELVEKEVEEEIREVIQKISLDEIEPTQTYDEEFKIEIENQMDDSYEYKKEQDFKLKMSVTEIKKRTQILEESEDVMTLEEIMNKKSYTPPVKIVPDFMKEEQEVERGAFRGTAYHRFMELWDFTKDYKKENLSALLENHITKGRMSSEMATCIESDVIERFMESSIAKRMKEAAKQQCYYKEQPFVLGVSATKVYGVTSDEMILVQGIIDVYFQEDDELVVVDYKTDQVKSLSELEKRYHAQLEYYGQALEQLTGKKVKERIIYSLTLQDYIGV
ncbi:MAG: 3'-5' exonuclease, partial [Eubacteriales bacterium]